MGDKLKKIVTRAEFTATEKDDTPKIEACFVKYNSPAPYGWGCEDAYEQIAPGCFTDALIKNTDIQCYYNHDYSVILGRQSAGTLMLDDRADGLYGVVTINKNDDEAMNVYSRVQRGDINGCSFGAYINDEGLTEKGDVDLWTVKKADLLEVSICPMPFYDTTSAAARKKDLDNSHADKKRNIKNRMKLAKTKLKLQGVKNGFKSISD